MTRLLMGQNYPFRFMGYELIWRAFTSVECEGARDKNEIVMVVKMSWEGAFTDFQISSSTISHHWKDIESATKPKFTSKNWPLNMPWEGNDNVLNSIGLTNVESGTIELFVPHIFFCAKIVTITVRPLWLEKNVAQLHPMYHRHQTERVRDQSILQLVHQLQEGQLLQLAVKKVEKTSFPNVIVIIVHVM